MGIRENKIKNDYYVYLHKDLNDKIFYVGKGRNKRAYSKAHRSKKWHAIAQYGYTVQIYCSSLSECEALKLEENLIISTDGLINQHTFKPVIFSDYSDYFYIDSSSPSGISRKIFKGSDYSTNRQGHCGYIAKFNKKVSGWRVKFKNKAPYAHRIIWEILNGTVPPNFLIDHIDGNVLNNCPENLRLVRSDLNSKNKAIYKNNTTGIAGVKKYSRGFVASWTDLEGNDRSRSFNANILGEELAFKLACECRINMLNILNEQGAGYTERHGT